MIPSSTIEAVCDLVVDCPHSTPQWTEDGVLVFRNHNIRSGQLDLSKPSFTTEAEYVKRVERAVPSPGDIIITREAPMGEVALIPEGVRGCLGQRMVLLRPNSAKVDKRFLTYALISFPVQNEIRVRGGTGSTVSNLRIPSLKSLPFRCPHLPEQRAIATALSDVDSLLDGLGRLITKKRDLKQAAMQQLLTGQTRLPGFQGEWEVKRLGELARLSKSSVNPSSMPHTLFTHFSLPAFDAGEAPIVETGASIGSNKFVVPPNAVLLSKLNPRIPRVWVPQHIPNNSVCSTEFLVLQPNPGVDRAFVKHLCASPAVSSRMQLHATGTTGSHQRIPPSKAMSIEVAAPREPTEQTAIAAVITDMDAELAAIQQRLTKTSSLKQAMIQELLTGKTRLVSTGGAHA